ncbi:MAG TPA: hypothetical protein VGG38_17030 [Acidimicrobiales bacterium]
MGTTTLTMAEALAEHLAESGLPPDGGDTERFVVVKPALLPYPIPNTAARKRAVKIHDLDHLVTGFETDRIGELEIAAWELASGGCQHYTAAWVLNLAGLVGGLTLAPRRVVRAYTLGRRQQNLYAFPLEELLVLTVDQARARVDSAPRRRTPVPLHLAGMVLLALPAGAAMAVAWWGLVPAWLISRRSARPLGEVQTT